MDTIKMQKDVIKLLFHLRKYQVYTKLQKYLSKKTFNMNSKIYDDLYNVHGWAAKYRNQYDSANRLYQLSYNLMRVYDEINVRTYHE